MPWACWFSGMSLSKWSPGSHIGFFWFSDSDFSLAFNIEFNFTGTALMCMGISLLIFSNTIFKMAAWQPYLIFMYPEFAWVCFGIEFQISYAFCFWPWAKASWFSNISLSKWRPGHHIWFFSGRTRTLIWLWIASPNFISKLLVCMERSLLIFSSVTLKIAAWQPYWTFWFPDSNFSLALNFKFKLHWHITDVYMGRSLLIFSNVAFLSNYD